MRNEIGDLVVEPVDKSQGSDGSSSRHGVPHAVRLRQGLLGESSAAVPRRIHDFAKKHDLNVLQLRTGERWMSHAELKNLALIARNNEDNEDPVVDSTSSEQRYRVTNQDIKRLIDAEVVSINFELPELENLPEELSKDRGSLVAIPETLYKKDIWEIKNELRYVYNPKTKKEGGGLIAQGQGGSIYQAWDLKYKRWVVLKFAPQNVSDDRLEQFIREARITGFARSHGQVSTIGVHDLIKTKTIKLSDQEKTSSQLPSYIMVLEFVEGENLTEYIKEHSPTVEVRLQIITQLAKIIDYLHLKYGLLHYDLKPANIIHGRISGYEGICLLDYGISVNSDESRQEDYYVANHEKVLGTPRYLSPERVDDPIFANKISSEVYSLAVIAFEILTGGVHPKGFISYRPKDAHGQPLPDNDERVKERERQELEKHSEGYCKVRNKLSAEARNFLDQKFEAFFNTDELHKVFAKALDPNANLRYKTATEFAEALAACRKPLGESQASTTVV